LSLPATGGQEIRMPKTKYTPGPWTLRQFGVIYGGPFQRYTNGSAQSQIAMATGADFMVEGEREANAKLIAAAPCMLADLREAAATLRRYEELHRAKGTDDSTAKAEVNDALATRFEATIAKATE
jgi:hypothetical protein